MSILGPGGLPALGLAASAAAAQQRAAALTDRDKADQAQQKTQADQVRLANRDLDDSIETDFSHGQVSDRDSDGRLLWQRPDGSSTGEDELDEKDKQPRGCDAEGDCGRALDVDA
jgi:hypothetical protein